MTPLGGGRAPQIPHRVNSKLPSTALETQISFGYDVTKPGQMVARTAADVLFGIRDGEWRSQIESMRLLPPDAQRLAKEKLPYACWNGEFSYRNNSSLVKHSGLVGIDLDGLNSDSTRSVMHCAMDDPHCAAAFRSARGQGVRLVIRVPTVTAPQHGLVFDAAATHVRSRYGVQPDSSGRDVSRASFVSWDGGLWLNRAAVALNVLLPDVGGRHGRGLYTVTHCVKQPVEWWVWLAREYVPFTTKADGTMHTHKPLLDLGLRLSLRLERECLWRGSENIIEVAAGEWFNESRRKGLRLRGELAEYADELRGMVVGARKCKWFRKSANVWLRWQKELDFPKDDPKAALLFTIRRHCEEIKSRHFYIATRDAALVIGATAPTASKRLNELCRDGYLHRCEGPRAARNATEFDLVES